MNLAFYKGSLGDARLRLPRALVLCGADPAGCPGAVYDYQVTNSEGRVFNKLVFFSWCV